MGNGVGCGVEDEDPELEQPQKKDPAARVPSVTRSSLREIHASQPALRASCLPKLVIQSASFSLNNNSTRKTARSSRRPAGIYGLRRGFTVYGFAYFFLELAANVRM